MGEVLHFPPGASGAGLRVLPYGAWLTDARLSGLGYSALDIRAIRNGEPIGRVVARRSVDAAPRQPADPEKFVPGPRGR